MKSILKRTTILAAAFIFCAFLIPSVVHATDLNDHKTVIRPDQPMQLPGIVLEPNQTYTLRLSGVSGSHDLVQVLNANHQVLATIATLPDIRLDSDNRTVFTLIKQERGHPTAIKSWFFPDSLSGLEFLYPARQARRIAAYSGQLPEDTVTSSIDSLYAIPVSVVRLHDHPGRTNSGQPIWKIAQ